MAKRRLPYPVFRQPPRVVFGRGSVSELPDVVPLEGTVFFVSAHPGVRDVLSAALEKRGSRLSGFPMLEKPKGEPTLEMAACGGDWLKRQSCSCLVAIGGGSVLDWARLSMAAARGWLGSGAEGHQASSQTDDRPGLVLVPTTCGTGAEAAAIAVYSVEGRKRAVVMDAFLADRVILDPQFLSGVPAGVLESFLCDALSHAVEGYVSIVPNPLAKAAALNALGLILEFYPARDASCRDERLMEAGFLGGVAASNCSVGVIHAFAHSSAVYGVPHGVANALGLRAGLTTNSTTPAMIELLRRAGFDSIQALVDAVAPIATAAVGGLVADRVAAMLRDSRERENVRAAMMADVCLRTNPRRLQPPDLEAFLTDVEHTCATI
ncbi:MAG: iron-containing alcohol dehydrogenase [Acidobacteriota bacterium]